MTIKLINIVSLQSIQRHSRIYVITYFIHMSVDVFMNIKNENDLKNYFEVVKVFQDGSTKAQCTFLVN